MANKAPPLALVALFILLALSQQVLGGRDIQKKAKDVDMKQPEFLIKSDRSVLIPGIGRVLCPPKFDLPSYNPYTGSPSIGSPIIGTPGGQGHLPGGDDTYVPNPGFEVPNPANGGVQAPPHP